MHYHDRKIKKAIQKEDFVLPPEYEAKLQKTLQPMEEQDSGRVMKYFRQRRMRHRLVLAMVPVMMAAVVFIGAGQLKRYTGIDLWGNVVALDNSSEGEDWDAIQTYMKEKVSYGQFLKYSSVMSVSAPYVPWQDVPKGVDAEQIRSQASADIRMPSDVPEGYEFTKAQVQFYLDGNVEECALQNTEKKGRYMYQIFDFPGGFEKNISGLVYNYQAEDGHYLNCQATLLNNGTALFDDGASVRELELEGYETVQEITEEDRISLMVTQKISPIEPVTDIVELGKEECFQYLKEHHVPFASKWKKMYETEDEGEAEEGEEELEDYNSFYYISYWLSSDVLSGEELLEIAKEMQ